MIDADTKVHSLVLECIFIHVLHLDCALRCLDGASEFSNDTFSGLNKNFSVMLCNHNIDHLASFPEYLYGFFLVFSHHLAETDYVGSKYGAKF